MVEEFKKYISENELLKDSDSVLLAVSGGIDSMVMAHLFLSAGIKSAIAHCNFNLRGKESDEDEQFVRRFAEAHEIPFHSVSFDTTGFSSEKNISIQMAARELRYRWFEEIRIENKYDIIALAHNLNDNVETFLINLTRGTGIAGLTGIKPRYKNLIRPMLFASRKAITDYCNTNNIAFREDRTNSDTKYIRNKFRHKIIPLFREVNPSFDTTIEETTQKLSDINEILTGYISGIREKSMKLKGNTVVFKLSEILEISPLRTILFELFKPFGIGTGQLDDLLNLTRGKTGSQIFTQTHRLLKNRSEIIVTPRNLDSEYYFEISSEDDLKKVPGIIAVEMVKITPSFRIPSSKNTGCIDPAKLSFPLIIRKWESGDIFYPIGMENRKKLSDYFIDRKFSVFEKENCTLLESAGRIVWIIGERLDNRFKITASSREALILKVKK